MAVCEDPHVMIGSLYIDTSLIDVHERTFKDSLDNCSLSDRVLGRKPSHDAYDAGFTYPLAKEVFHRLKDGAIGKAKSNSLVDHPRLKGMTKGLEVVPNRGGNVINTTP